MRWQPSFVIVFAISAWSMTLAAAGPSTAPSSSPPAAASAPLPTIDELHQMLDAKQYSEALQGVGRILVRSDAVAGYDRFELLRIKAESQLQLHDKLGCMSTLDQMRRAADQGASVDDKAKAIAMSTLVKKANAKLAYAPQTAADKTPIDILDAESRKQAMSALLDDEMAVLEQKEVNSKTDFSEKPLRDIALSFSEVQSIERASTGGTTKTDAKGKELSQWASKLIDRKLDNFEEDLKRIGRHADRTVSGTEVTQHGMRQRHHKAGLDSSEIDELQTIRDTCAVIPQVITDLNHAFPYPLKLKGSGTSNRASEIKNRATNLLENGTDNGA